LFAFWWLSLSQALEDRHFRNLIALIRILKIGRYRLAVIWQTDLLLTRAETEQENDQDEDDRRDTHGHSSSAENR